MFLSRVLVSCKLVSCPRGPLCPSWIFWLGAGWGRPAPVSWGPVLLGSGRPQVRTPSALHTLDPSILEVVPVCPRPPCCLCR